MERLLPENMKNSGSDKGNALKELVMERIWQLGIHPNENLGQHFLIDQASVDLLAQSVNPGNTVIEIGAGVGQLTEALAQRATKVISVEIDRRYEPVLTQITRQYPNVKVIFKDALALRFEDFIPKRREDTGVQIVANLPFHITEPFMHKIAGLPIENATLAVGERLVDAIQAPNEESIAFGQLTLLAQTFFDTDVVAVIEKKKFYPVPRTDSAIIRLIPKEAHEFRSNRREFLLRRLFLTAKRSPLVKNALKEGLIEFAQVSEMGTLSKKEYNHKQRRTVKVDLKRMVMDYNHFGAPQSGTPKPRETEERFLTQNQARAIIERMGIPDSVLDKPFQQLNNSEMGILSKALRE
jgi:16S rRNA (adenine1518-N6/adenine1519-N6)-dimethyltransferase